MSSDEINRHRELQRSLANAKEALNEVESILTGIRDDELLHHATEAKAALRDAVRRIEKLLRKDNEQ